MPSNSEALADLQPYLERIAHKMTLSCYSQLDPQDVLQEMNLAMPERADVDPSFLDEAPGYVSRFAAWRGRDRCKRQCAHIAVDLEVTGSTLSEPRPDQDLAIDVGRLLDGLSAAEQWIAQRLGAGYTQTEIARELGYSSHSGIGRTMRHLRHALEPAMAG
jgi:DNA-directed RNA polymerase specialized sigma24 family protein